MNSVPHSLNVQKSCSPEALRVSGRKTRVGIHGLRGSFTDEAWHRFSTHLGLQSDDYEVVELVHAENVLRAAAVKEVDIGIVAFSNSGSGGYQATIEAMGKHQFELLAMFTMPIVMCILGKKQVSDVSTLRKFFGHPVALAQCRRTLEERWPTIPVEPAGDEMDTALSASKLAEGDIDVSTGIFASKRAAELYGLKILAEGVHHDPRNTTAFAVVRMH